MTCPRCGAASSAGRRFCAECGSPLALTCSGCDFSSEPGVKFCGGGTALVASVATPGPRVGPLESYSPKHLAEKIVTSRRALESERRQVTVLFAGLKGGMDRLADRAPPAPFWVPRVPPESEVIGGAAAGAWSSRSGY